MNVAIKKIVYFRPLNIILSQKDGWRKEPNLPEIINDPAMTGFEPDRSLFVIGGKINARESNSVRILKRKTWEIGPYLPERLSGAQALFLDHYIYVFGGSTTQKIFRYSPKDKNNSKWETYGQLNTKRQNLGEFFFIKNTKTHKLSKSG